MKFSFRVVESMHDLKLNKVVSSINGAILYSTETLPPDNIVNLDIQLLFPSTLQRLGGIVHLFREGALLTK